MNARGRQSLQTPPGELVAPPLRNCYKGTMAERPMHLQTNYSFSLNPRRERTSSEDAGETRRVETVVVALIPEYHQVKVRDGDGHLYALTRKTQGVDLVKLSVSNRFCSAVMGSTKLMRNCEPESAKRS